MNTNKWWPHPPQLVLDAMNIISYLKWETIKNNGIVQGTSRTPDTDMATDVLGWQNTNQINQIHFHPIVATLTCTTSKHVLLLT